MLCFLFVCLFDTRVLTTGLILDRQALYHLSMSLARVLTFATYYFLIAEITGV
jgi:hypothetical protein